LRVEDGSFTSTIHLWGLAEFFDAADATRDFSRALFYVTGRSAQAPNGRRSVTRRAPLPVCFARIASMRRRTAIESPTECDEATRMRDEASGMKVRLPSGARRAPMRYHRRRQALQHALRGLTVEPKRAWHLSTADPRVIENPLSQAYPYADSESRAQTFEPALSHNMLFWTLQAGGWFAVGMVVLGFELTKEAPAVALFDVVVFVATGFLLTSLYRYPYRRWRRLETPLPVIAAWILVLGVIGVPLWFEPQMALTRLASTAHPSWVAEVPSAKISVECWLQWGAILYGWSFLYFGLNDWMSLQSERRRAAAAEVSAQGARLRALQSQLQPHFLFNTLNSISSLILDGRSTTAVSMIGQLGELLRLSLQTSETPRIPLEKEIFLLSCYLEIEKTRFGERLQYRFDIAPEASAALVPTLLLQPLVENAVRHGILPVAGGGSIAVSARVENGLLKLRIEDDGQGLSGEPSNSPGFGLGNVAKRLEALFGNHAVLVVGRGTAGGVAIDLELPFMTAP
jgi:two-component system, LytTR family, sensor kinase